MSKNASSTTLTTVRDSKTGQIVTVKGVGALKGKMTISEKVDLTKPISGQNADGKWTLKDGNSSTKASRSGHIAAKH